MNRNLAVGIFALFGLILFSVGLFMIGNRHEAFAKHFVVYTDFVNLSGIAKGSKVQVAGMGAGTVEEIHVPHSPAEKFRLKIKLDEKLHGLVRTDSLATVSTEGVVGETFVLILPGSAAAPIVPANGVLPSKEAFVLSDMLDQAKGTMTDVDAAIRNANGLLTSLSGNLNTTLATAQTTMTNVNDVVVSIKRGDGTAGMLLRDPKLADSIRESINNTQAATKNLQQISTNANALLTDIQSRAFPQKIDETLASVKDTTTRVNGTTQDIQKMVGEMVAPDELGTGAGTNLREAISNMNSAAGNLTDDTEALKHNFLTRGFFRKRGYYSLTGIAPDTYRKDSAFASAKNARLWLEPGNLFVRNSKGEDELTPQGKASIDQAIAQYSDLIQGAPIMVEGYDEAGAAAEKIELSRERALVVRNYIVSRYHLDSLSVGAIGLSGQAPQGSEHASWDGICVVLIRRGH